MSELVYECEACLSRDIDMGLRKFDDGSSTNMTGRLETLHTVDCKCTYSHLTKCIACYKIYYHNRSMPKYRYERTFSDDSKLERSRVTTCKCKKG